MFRRRFDSPRGFTLVEMLVVLGIIAVLIALLMPAVVGAINSARRASIATEISQLADAVESYKKDKGDYPPNFQDVSAVVRHIRRCYPKIAPTEFAAVFTFAPSGVPNGFTPLFQLDEGECLVAWLTNTRNDPRYPFGMTGGTDSPRKVYYQFDETRLVDDDGDSRMSYRARHCGETCYAYLDSRSYDDFVADFTDRTTAANVEGGTAYADPDILRPYWSEIAVPGVNLSDPMIPESDKYKPMNETTFQIIAAGQDGEWGLPAANIKYVPGGNRYTEGDQDNITNFSNGRRLGDLIP